MRLILILFLQILFLTLSFGQKVKRKLTLLTFTIKNDSSQFLFAENYIVIENEVFYEVSINNETRASCFEQLQNEKILGLEMSDEKEISSIRELALNKPYKTLKGVNKGLSSKVFWKASTFNAEFYEINCKVQPRMLLGELINKQKSIFLLKKISKLKKAKMDEGILEYLKKNTKCIIQYYLTDSMQWKKCINQNVFEKQRVPK